MANLWYWFTSANHTKHGMKDAEDGLPKLGDSGDVYIPPHLDVLKDRYETYMSNDVEEWVRKDGALQAKYSPLKARLKYLKSLTPKVDNFAALKHYVIMLAFGILELPITFIALESVFKENIIITACSVVAFAVCIVVVGDVLGRKSYEEELLEGASRFTKLLVIVALLVVSGLSYFRYVHQVEQTSKEKERIIQKAELEDASASAAYMESIHRLDAKSPAAVSLVFLAMSMAFLLLAMHFSKKHLKECQDEKLIRSLMQFIRERMERIHQQRRTLYESCAVSLDVLRQSAQREFAQYLDGLIRGNNVTGEIMHKLKDKIKENFQVEVSEKLVRIFPASVDEIDKSCDTEQA